MQLMKLLWRRRLVVIPTLLVGGVALGATYKLAPPTYRVSSSMVLLSPPLPPADAPPNASNPYVRLGSLGVMVDVVARITQSPSEAAVLRARGASGTYVVAPNIAFYSGPIVDFTAEAKSAAAAQQTATLVMADVQQQLVNVQKAQGTDPAYFITSALVVPPDHPTTVFSSTLRRLIAVAVVVGILVLLMAALADALANRRTARRLRRRGSGLAREDAHLNGAAATPSWSPGQPASAEDGSEPAASGSNP